MTDKRFSATQYALFSSLVGLTRTLVGPIAGLLADALGWRDFFVFAIFCGVPGLLFLRRFAPWGHDTTDLSADTAITLPRGAPWPRATLTSLGAGAGVAFTLLGLLVTGGLRTIKTWRATHAVDVLQAMLPTDPVVVFGSVLLGVCGGLAVAAYLAARGRRNVASES
jgi:PAT family beta-lactamase induction signal transducer AmpG